MDKLKPCPFCGGEASRSMGITNDGKDWPYIECIDCAAMAEPEEWNKRVIDEQLQAENKKLREILIREVDDGRAEVDDIGIEAWLEQALKGD